MSVCVVCGLIELVKRENPCEVWMQGQRKYARD